MSYQYYVMDIGEIFWLLLVLSLWALSIVCCIKRYEKISTIERADIVPRKIAVGNELSTSSSTNNNNIAIQPTISDYNSIKASTTNSLVDQNRSKELSTNGHIPNISTTNSKVSFGDNSKQSNVKNLLIIDETLSSPSSTSNTFNSVIRSQKIRNEVIAFTKAHKATATVFCSMNPHQKRIRSYRQAKKLNKEQFMSINNQTFYKIVQLKCIQQKSKQLRSNSESALQNLLSQASVNENNSFVTAAAPTNTTNVGITKPTAPNRLFRSASSDALNKDKMPLALNLFDHFDQATISCLNNNQAPAVFQRQETNHLIDPNQIPHIVRKSLIDLHRKSMLNVSIAIRQESGQSLK